MAQGYSFIVRFDKKKIKPKQRKTATKKRSRKPGTDDVFRAVLITAIFLFSSIIVAILVQQGRQPSLTDGGPDSKEDAVAVTEAIEPAVPAALPAAEPPRPPAVPQAKPAEPARPPAVQEKTIPPKTPPTSLVPQKERPKIPRPRGGQGELLFVIDDCGNNLRELEKFLSHPGQLTLAVLPGLPYSREAARLIRAAGKEVILHQPMEALGGQNPGPGAIYSDMSEEEIRSQLQKNFEEIGPAIGLNNHQGSKITENRRIMDIVLAFCQEEGYFFLDSRTTAGTVVSELAQERGMEILERDIFLDNESTRTGIFTALDKGLVGAEKKGIAVMIGHAWSSELADVLHEMYPEFVEAGWSLSSIARLMMGKTLDLD